jgi:uncharacterized protein (TIGR04255 family)
MQNRTPRFPIDMPLSRNSLAEAWLEIRWRLAPGDPPQFSRDVGFPFALGRFHSAIRKRLRHVESLEANNAPFDIAYAVKYRFRPAPDSWPIIQIGPGVASVNFTSPYSWNDFQELAGYLRENLLAAYAENTIEVNQLSLRYRNVAPFSHSSNDVVKFLGENLNVTLQIPETIPGYAGSKTFPTSANINLTFDLISPKGTGTLNLVTGTSQKLGEVLVWQLEVSSGDRDAPDIQNPDKFNQWLGKAHAAIHEWYFSLIEGPLLEQFTREGK